MPWPPHKQRRSIREPGCGYLGRPATPPRGRAASWRRQGPS